MDLLKEIEKRRLELGLKKTEMAQLFGVEPQNYNNWVYRGSLPKEQYTTALTLLGLDQEGLSLLSKPAFNLPLLDWEDSLSWCQNPDQLDQGKVEYWLPAPQTAGKRSFALRITNDAMVSPHPGQRSYPPDTIIYVDPDQKPISGRRVLSIVNGQCTFKTFVEDSGRKFLIPLNPAYDKIDVTEQLEICGLVIGSYIPE